MPWNSEVSKFQNFWRTTIMEFVGVGEKIASSSEAAVIGGHGTLDIGDQSLIATVSGFVERLNKLVTVRPVRTRYSGEVGDVIVGRITAVEDKRWKVDINATRDAVLQLSSVNLPGGVQRRKTQADELQMRNFFKEGDLISAEVQKVGHNDGLVNLHTRNAKYGMLKYGTFVKVNQSLVKRCRQHFIDLPDSGVFLILGNNGYIWVSLLSLKPMLKDSVNSEVEQEEQESKRMEAAYSEITAEDREKIARVRNCVVALDRMFYGIWPETIQAVYEESLIHRLRPSEILDPKYVATVTQSALAVHGQDEN
jgi:exosome complex component RRP4